MKDKLIKNYIDNLTIDKIETFASSKDILLTKSELNYVFNTIKTDWETLIYGNPENIFNQAKNNINSNSYNKIIELYNYYKVRYKDLLV